MNLFVILFRILIRAIIVTGVITFTLTTINLGMNDLSKFYTIWIRSWLIATFIAFLRQIVGIKAFGIYTPLLITFAFLATVLQIGREAILCPLPLSHVFSFGVVSVGMMLGAHTVLVSNPRKPESIVEQFEAHAITVMIGANSLFVETNSIWRNRDDKCFRKYFYTF